MNEFVGNKNTNYETHIAIREYHCKENDNEIQINLIDGIIDELLFIYKDMGIIISYHDLNNALKKVGFKISKI